MDPKEKELEKKISMAELEDEELDHELTKTQKKAAIRELKRQYGRDWKQVLKDTVRSVKVNRETLHALHGAGADLRSFNDPRSFRR